MYLVDDEDCIAYGVCRECGLKKYFVDYYGETKPGITLEGLKKRVISLNESYLKGLEIPAPPRGNRSAMREYYEKNKKRIFEQIRKYGMGGTALQWGISVRTLERVKRN
jgi:hypothetical protein